MSGDPGILDRARPPAASPTLVVDSTGLAKIDAGGAPVPPEDVGRVVSRAVGLAVAFGSRVERTEDANSTSAASAGIAACTASIVTGRVSTRNSALCSLSSASSCSFRATRSCIGLATVVTGTIRREALTPAAPVAVVVALSSIDQVAIAQVGHASPHARERIGHRVQHAALALQQHQRGECACGRIVGASFRCSEIVLSVRSATLRANASFCRSEPTARLSSSWTSTIASERRWNSSACSMSPDAA